jgi:hypothetical protein
MSESIAIKKPSLSSPLPTDSPVASPGSLASTPPASPSLASPSCKRVFLKKNVYSSISCHVFEIISVYETIYCHLRALRLGFFFVLDVTGLGVLSMSCSLKGEGECVA